MFDLKKIEDERNKRLKAKGYSPEKLLKFRKKIKKVSEEEANKLGIELLKIVQSKNYDEVNSFKKVEELVLQGADLEVRSKKCGDTPLLKISKAKKEFYDTFNLLVRGGACINAQSIQTETTKRTIFGGSPTMWSARRGYHRILEDLILLEADINLTYTDGENALHSASRHGQVKSAEMLAEAGIILNAKSNLGVEPLGLAREKRHTEVIEFFENSLSEEASEILYSDEDIFNEIEKAKEKIKLLTKK